jgi:hypothetical protein
MAIGWLLSLPLTSSTRDVDASIVRLQMRAAADRGSRRK